MALFSSITLLLSVACWCKSVFGYFSRLLHVGMAGKQSDGLTLITPHIWSTKGQTYSLIKCTVFPSRYMFFSDGVSKSHPHKFRRNLEPGTSCWHVWRPLNQCSFNIYYNYSVFLLHGFLVDVTGCWLLSSVRVLEELIKNGSCESRPAVYWCGGKG